MASKYSEHAQEKVHKALHEEQEGTLKSGRSNKKVTNRKQAIAIGLSEAREDGAKVPEKKKASKKAPAKKASSKKNASKKATASKKTSAKKEPAKKAPAKKAAAKKAAAKK